MSGNGGFKQVGIDVELLAIVENDAERAFVLMNGCPMSKMPECDRLQPDPLWSLVPKTHCEFITGEEVPRCAGLGSYKLSGQDDMCDDELNREEDSCEVLKDWQREEKLSFSSFEEMGEYFKATSCLTQLKQLSLYQLKVLTGIIDSKIPDELRIQNTSEVLEIIATKEKEAADNAKLSLQFHVCSEYMRRKYPELADRFANDKTRCRLCKKVARLGMVMWPALGSRENKSVLNASIMYQDPDKELAVLGHTVSACQYIKRSALLEEILIQFQHQFRVGKMIKDIRIRVDREKIEKRIEPLIVDINTIGSIDTAKNASGTSEFSRFQEGILSRSMRIPTTKVLVEECLSYARNAYVQKDKVLSHKAEEVIENHIKETATRYLGWFKMTSNLRWRAPVKDENGQPVRPWKDFGCMAIKTHDIPILCTRCSHQWECQGAIVKPHILKDYSLKV
jgi:hypothetical protein